MTKFNKFVMFAALICIFSQNVRADEPFLPTWKLMNQDAKRQFVAGYLFGLKDAENVLDIAIQYIQENPNKAIEGLKKIKSVYQHEDAKPDKIAKAMDEYFSDTANAKSTLATAFQFAKLQ